MYINYILFIISRGRSGAGAGIPGHQQNANGR